MLGLILLLTVVGAILLLLALIARRERQSAGVEWSGSWRETSAPIDGAFAAPPPEVARRRTV